MSRLANAWIACVSLLPLGFGCGGRVVYWEEGVDEEAVVNEASGGSPALPQERQHEEPESVDCSGSFGEPVVLFEDEGWSPQALSPTRDTLEFFYARQPLDAAMDPDRKRKITVRRRQSVDEPFGDPLPVLELDDVCTAFRADTEVAGLDVSGDGLRLYIACNSFDDPLYGSGPLVVAERVDRTSPFGVVQSPLGAVGFSIGLTRDELTLYATSRDPSVDYVLRHQRSSLGEPFGEAQAVEGRPTIRNPEPLPGGLSLFGADRSPSTSSHLVGVYRPNETEDFGAPSSDGLPMVPDSMSDHSPALSGDCRTLYFTRYQFSPKRVYVMQATR